MKKFALSMGVVLATLAAQPALAKNTHERARVITAATIGNMLSDQVTIVDHHGGMSTAHWTAVTPLGTYNCEGDDMYRHANCIKAGGPSTAPQKPPHR